MPPIALSRLFSVPSPGHHSTTNEMPNLENAESLLEVHPLENLSYQLSPSTDPKPSPTALSSATTKQLQIHAYLTLFSILGTLTRLGLIALTTYPFSPLSGVIWANFAGCILMGFLVSNPGVFGAGKASLPLYTGLTTGLCGSITSFSSLEVDAFQEIFQHPHAGESFMAVVGYVVSTLALSLGGLQLGAHLGAAGGWGVPSGVFRALDYAALPLGPLCWAAAVILAAAWPHHRSVMLSLAFSPVGAILRFWISRALNPRVLSFPVGTFACNLSGCLVLAGMGIGTRVWAGDGCRVMKGVSDGFCGCLSTVSTFAVELRGLKVRAAYVYAAVSVGAGFAVVVMVLGSWAWGKGMGLGVAMC